jgi:hypothetical protein
MPRPLSTSRSKAPHGPLLPVEPRGEANPPDGLISNPKEGTQTRGEEEVAHTSAIGASKPGNRVKREAQFMSQCAFPIRRALSIEDALDLCALEEVIDMPMKGLFLLEVTM